MIGNLSDRKFIVIQEVINLKKNFNGLFAWIEQNGFAIDFFNNTAIVFVNRRRNMFKCIYWENDGLAIWNKVLTKGTFANFKIIKKELSFHDLLLFIHGFIPPENR